MPPLKLYHMTSVENAVSILREQEMHAGKHGLCGPAIYFGADPNRLDRKAHRFGVTLCADVDLGKVMMARKDNCVEGEDWAPILEHRGYDSVQCTGLRSGDEYVVYEPERFLSIALYSSTEHLLTGHLRASPDATKKRHRRYVDHPVRIVMIDQRARARFPIQVDLAGNGMGGWCTADRLKLAKTP
jgi:hypothetical protein